MERGVSYAATARGFYRNDGNGKSWELAVEGLTRDFTHDFLVCEGASESVLFLTTANGSPPAWIRPTKAESSIFRSTDQARTWEQVEGGLPFSSEMMAWRLAGDPMDRGRLSAVYGAEPSRPGGPADPARGPVWPAGTFGRSRAPVPPLPAAPRGVVGQGRRHHSTFVMRLAAGHQDAALPRGVRPRAASGILRGPEGPGDARRSWPPPR